MRRSLAKRGIDGAGQSTLAALLEIPTDPENLRISSRKPVKFVTTPRSQLADMDHTELSVLEVDILRKIETVNTTISSLNVDAHTMKRAYELHLAEIRHGGNDGNGRGEKDARVSSSAYSHLLIQQEDGMYGEEAMLRLRELFMEYCAPGMDVLGYPEMREMLRAAGVLPSVENDEQYVAESTVGGRAYGLTDAFQDQTTFETFVVETLAESYGDISSESGGSASAAASAAYDEQEEENNTLVCALIPGQGLGLRFLGFFEFVRRLEMYERTTLLDMLQTLNKPLSTTIDRWRRRIEHLVEYTCRCAVEERGPTEDEIEYANQQRELLKLQSKKGRPVAKKKKKKKKKKNNGGSSTGTGGGKNEEEEEGKEMNAVVEEKTKEEKRGEIMKRRMELEQARKRDQKLQWKRRYKYDVDHIVTPKSLSLLLYTLNNIVLNLDDAALLLAPLVLEEKADDEITFENARNAQRTKRLRVIVEKQGMPPREFPMKSTLLTNMIQERMMWLSIRHSIVFHPPGYDPNVSSRPSSRGSRGSRSRPGSRPGSRNSSRPGSKGGSRPGSSGGGGGGGGGGNGGSSGWGAVLDAGPSPQFWSRKASLFIETSTKRIRNIGRKVRGYIMEESLRFPKTSKPVDSGLSTAQALGKSKSDRKARKKAKAEALARQKQLSKEEDCNTRVNIAVGAVDKASIDLGSDKEDQVSFEMEWVRDKQMDVGDLLDEVDCPEECGTFISISFGVEKEFDNGTEENDNEIDKAVQVLRRICKLLLVEQVFEKMPGYHSYSVMYDPDQPSPRVVRLSLYMEGSEEELRKEYGVPMRLSEIFQTLNVRGMMRPSGKSLFHGQKGENLILNNEFQLRGNINIGFKRKIMSHVMNQIARATEEFYPFASQHHSEEIARDIAAKKTIEEILLGEEGDEGDEGEEGEEGEETKDGKSKTTSALAKDMQNAKKEKELPLSEHNEKEGGTGVMLWFRTMLDLVKDCVLFDTKQEFEIAVPSLSHLLLPELPDCFQGHVTPKTRAMLAHLINGAGGIIDTVKLLWNGIIGHDWSWENFNNEMFKLLVLLEHGETNKTEELIHASHYTFRKVLTSIHGFRIQCGDRGLVGEFKHLSLIEFIPSGPSKSQIAERERLKKERQMRAGK